MTEQQQIDERRRYVQAFNTTMLQIWQEQILKLGVIDTGRLYRSVRFTTSSTDAKIITVHLGWELVEYGVYQDRGTGRETPRGNPGDIGRAKIRQVRPWLTKKYYASYLNIRDYFAHSLGAQFCAAIPEVLGAHI